MRLSFSTLIISLITAFSLMTTSSLMAEEMQGGMEDMFIEVPSPLGFEETLEEIEVNAKALGWKVPKKWKVNFQKNLKKVTDIDIGKNRVLKMCAPEPAAKLLVQDKYKKLTALMPCTIAVYEKSDGKVYISLLNMQIMGKMYGGDLQKMADTLGPEMMEMVTLEKK